MAGHRQPVWLSWSSGKDSAYALHVLRQSTELEVVGLLTTITAPYQRVSMHGVRENILDAQAVATGLPLHKVYIPAPCSNEDYAAAMGAAMETAAAEGVRGIAFGDLFLEDIREYRETQLRRVAMSAHFPLWGRPTDLLAAEMLAAGMVATLSCVDTRRLPASFSGRRFDGELLAHLPRDIDPCGEHGEFHTCVSAGPMFDVPLRLRAGETVVRDGFAFADLELGGGAGA